MTEHSRPQTASDELNGMDIHAYLERHQKKDLLRFLTAGSVDDGKSTLIGRLLHDSKMIYEDQLAAVKQATVKHGTIEQGEYDLALLTDGLKAEREQGITIDVAYRYFSTSMRKFIIADAPGHEQYTRNMATGASTVDLAIILVDARHGVVAQTKRHSFIVSLLGVKHIVVAVNKMDLLNYDQQVFEQIRNDYESFSARLRIPHLKFIPISALNGDNVVEPSTRMKWYKGETLMHFLETVPISSDRNLIDLRFPIQYVLRPNLNFRGFCGTLAAGVLRKGDEVMVVSSGQRSRVKEIVTYDGSLNEAFAPQAITVTLEHEIDLSRGEMLVHPNNIPQQSDKLEAMVVWMHADALKVGRSYLLKHTSRTVTAEVRSVRYRIDVNTLQRQDADHLALNEIGRVSLSLNRKLFFDEYNRSRNTGNFILIDRLTNATLACGMIVDRTTDRKQELGQIVERASTKSLISPAERATRLKQQATVIWLTGLPKSGKTTIAVALERRLFDLGATVMLFDGVTMRQGLSRDLGFTAEDRSENSRRASEVAKLFADAGMIVVAAFVSPFAADRANAREVIGAERFIEVYLDTPQDVCEQRDDEGLYAKARKGEIKSLSGLNGPYEVPERPDLVLSPQSSSVGDSVEALLALLKQKQVLG